MKQPGFGRLALALLLALLLPTFTLGCGGKPEDAAKAEAGKKAAMEQGAAPTGEKGQSFQAPPAPPP
jgi:hypothetical protein